MAMIRVNPVKVEVRASWLDGTPREIVWGQERLRVTKVVAVRRETAAYPVATGPRTTFEVQAGGAALALTFRHRARRWTIDGLDDAVFGTDRLQVLTLAPRPS